MTAVTSSNSHQDPIQHEDFLVLMPERRHNAVVVQVGDLREEIDVALAPLIRELWIAGIGTRMSCEETEPGIAWINFETIDDLVRFLNVVAVYEEGADTLYNRIIYLKTGSLGPVRDLVSGTRVGYNP